MRSSTRSDCDPKEGVMGESETRLVYLGWDDGRLFVLDDGEDHPGLEEAVVPVYLLDALQQTREAERRLVNQVWDCVGVTR